VSLFEIIEVEVHLHELYQIEALSIHAALTTANGSD
jgi:hypothetical protein